MHTYNNRNILAKNYKGFSGRQGFPKIYLGRVQCI